MIYENCVYRSNGSGMVNHFERGHVSEHSVISVSLFWRSHQFTLKIPENIVVEQLTITVKQ